MGNQLDRIVPAARLEGLVITESKDEVLVYDTERHHIHHLNQVSAVVWRLCDGRRSTADLLQHAQSQLNADISAEVIQLALTKLEDANLLAGPLAMDQRGTGQTRRAFLRRSAIAGAVAVPAIVSMSAPAAAGQVSGLACADDCSSTLPPGDNRCNSQCAQCRIVEEEFPQCCNPGGGGGFLCP